MYVLGRNLDGTLHGGPLREHFLENLAPGIAESIKWFSCINHHLNCFLSIQVRDGFLSWGDASKCMFSDRLSEEQIWKQYTLGFPILSDFVRNPSPGRYFTRRSQLTHAVGPLFPAPLSCCSQTVSSWQISRVREGYSIEMGDAYFVWKALFDYPSFIMSLTVRDEAYRLFPATSFSDAPMLHSQGFGDLKEFARRLVVLAQQAAA